MSNPLRQKIPLRTDLRIRWRLFKARLSATQTFVAGLLFVPAIAIFLFMLTPEAVTVMPIKQEVLAAEIKQAQVIELEQSTSGIYHVVREITEGADKPAYVAEVLGVRGGAPVRTDRVETYQHGNTALALVESNGTTRSFEAFLSREHETGALSLHHYGPVTREVEEVRKQFDQAHNLATLYTAYTSLDRPDVPLLPETATIVGVDEAASSALFKDVVSDDITIEYIVDLGTRLVTEEIIYVRSQTGKTYEMTRITYVTRELIPAEEFESIFNPQQFEYEVIATRAAA